MKFIDFLKPYLTEDIKDSTIYKSGKKIYDEYKSKDQKTDNESENSDLLDKLDECLDQLLTREFSKEKTHEFKLIKEYFKYAKEKINRFKPNVYIPFINKIIDEINDILSVDEINDLGDKIIKDFSKLKDYFYTILKDVEDKEEENTKETSFIFTETNRITPSMMVTDEFLYVGIPLFNFKSNDVMITETKVIYPNGLILDLLKFMNELDYDKDFRELKHNTIYLRFGK